MTGFNTNLSSLFKNYQNQQKYNKKAYDVNKDKKTNAKDKTALTNQKNEILKTENLFDVNNDGIFNQEDINMFLKGDVDGNGKVSKEEAAFIKAYKSNLISVFNSKKLDFEVSGKRYVNGALANGKIGDTYYKDGAIANKTTVTIDGKNFYCENGQLYTGEVKDKTKTTKYQNGMFQYSITDNNGTGYPNGNGAKINFSQSKSLSINVGEKVIINKNGTVSITSEDGSTVKKYDKNGNLTVTEVVISSKVKQYQLNGITIQVDTSKKNSKFSYAFSNNKLTITGTNCKVDITSSNSNIEVVTKGSGLTLNSIARVKSITNNATKATINGSEYNDDIINNGASSTINAGAGFDTITNSGASSTIKGGDGNDTITNTAKSVKIYGEAGNDNITNKGASATVNGGDGNDTIKNYAKATIDGGVGNDTIYNYEKATGSTIKGSVGNDYISNYAKATVYGGDGNDTIYNYAKAKSSTVKGNAGDDKIYNYADSSKVYGEAGNDTITNSGKKATVSGGTGYDTIGGLVYKDNKIFNGISEADGKLYQKGKVYTGIYKNDSKLYINGLIPQGLKLYNNILYDNGSVSQGIEEYCGRLFSDGEPLSGVTTNRYVYKDGYLKCEIINNHDGYVPNREGDSPRIVDNTITFKSGEKITLNNREIAVINNDGSVTITAKDGKTLIAEYSKDAETIKNYTNGKLTKETVNYSNDNGTNVTAKEVKTYTYINGESKTLAVTKTNSAGKTLYSEQYTYDSKGNETRKVVYKHEYDDKGREVYSLETRYENKNLVKEIESISSYGKKNGSVYITNDSRITDYDDAGKRTTTLQRLERTIFGEYTMSETHYTNCSDGTQLAFGQGLVKGIWTAKQPQKSKLLLWNGKTAKQLSDN